MTELELRAHRLTAVGAIENLMSLNAYYHAANPDIDAPIQTDVCVEPVNSERQDRTEMPVRCLVSPVIEISADGWGAKGLWYSPGFSLHHDYSEGCADVKWVWEKCGADFAYENGAWRFSDRNFCMDMTAGEPNSWTEKRDDQNPDGHMATEEYRPCRIPAEHPKLPEPF